MKIRPNPFFPAESKPLSRELGVLWRELATSLNTIVEGFTGGGSGGAGGGSGSRWGSGVDTTDDVIIDNPDADVIYYRRFDGTIWGPESLLQDLSATALRSGLAPPEQAIDCSGGLAFVEGMAPPWNIRFTLGVGSCSTLQTTQGPGTVTVTGPGAFEMTFDQLRGGGLANFYDLAEDPGKSYDLAGGRRLPVPSNVHGLFHSYLLSGGTSYVTGTNNNGARVDLLEATPTRVRVRQEVFFQNVGTTILGGLKGFGDYSIYPQRVALRWNRRTTASVPQAENSLEIAVRRETAPDPRDTLNSYSETSSTSPAPATDDFILAQREVPGVRTDFLAIMNEPTGPDPDWTAADTLDWNITSRYHAWNIAMSNSFGFGGHNATVVFSNID